MKFFDLGSFSGYHDVKKYYRDTPLSADSCLELWKERELAGMCIYLGAHNELKRLYTISRLSSSTGMDLGRKLVELGTRNVEIPVRNSRKITL